MSSGWLRSADSSRGVCLRKLPAFAQLMPESQPSRLAQSFLVKALASSELRLRLLATIWGFGGAVPRPLR
jgi:hypothetical protein